MRCTGRSSVSAAICSHRSLAAPPSAAKTRADRKAAFGEDLDMVAEAENDPLQRRAPDIGDAVIEAQPDQRAAGMRIVERRLLPRACRAGTGPRRRPAWRRPAGRDGGAASRPPPPRPPPRPPPSADQPVEEAAARRHAAIGEIEAGHDVVVDEQPPVGDRLVGRQQDVPRAAELEHQVAVARRAADEGRGDMVGAAGNDRRPGLEPGVGGRRRRRSRRRPRGWLADRRQQARIDAGERDQLGIVAPVGDGRRTRPRAPSYARPGGCRTGAAVMKSEAPTTWRAAAKAAGSCRAQPHQLRPDQLLAVAGARQREESLLRHAAAKALELLDRPGVVLLDAAAEQAARRASSSTTAGSMPVTPTPAIVAGGEPRGQHGSGRWRRRCATIPRDPPPPSSAGRNGAWPAGSRPRARRRSIVDHHADRRGRADVEPEQERQGQSLSAACAPCP